MISKALPQINSLDEEEIRLLRVNIYMIQEAYDKARKELQELRNSFPNGECVLESIRFEYEVENYK